MRKQVLRPIPWQVLMEGNGKHHAACVQIQEWAEGIFLHYVKHRPPTVCLDSLTLTSWEKVAQISPFIFAWMRAMVVLRRASSGIVLWDLGKGI